MEEEVMPTNTNEMDEDDGIQRHVEIPYCCPLVDHNTSSIAYISCRLHRIVVFLIAIEV